MHLAVLVKDDADKFFETCVNCIDHVNFDECSKKSIIKVNYVIGRDLPLS